MAESTLISAVVLAAAFFTLFLGPSVTYANGVFHVALLEKFQDDITVTAWVGSVFGCMFALMGELSFTDARAIFQPH